MPDDPPIPDRLIRDIRNFDLARYDREREPSLAELAARDVWICGWCRYHPDPKEEAA